MVSTVTNRVHCVFGTEGTVSPIPRRRLGGWIASGGGPGTIIPAPLLVMADKKCAIVGFRMPNCKTAHTNLFWHRWKIRNSPLLKMWSICAVECALITYDKGPQKRSQLSIRTLTSPGRLITIRSIIVEVWLLSRVRLTIVGWSSAAVGRIEIDSLQIERELSTPLNYWRNWGTWALRIKRARTLLRRPSRG